MFLSIKREQLFTKERGFALLEVLLASSLFLIIVIFSVSAYLYGEEAVALSGNRQRAVFYADNNLEALYALKTTDFNSLVTGGPYYISTSSNNISLLQGELNVDGYTSSLSIGKIDDNRLVATSTVSWQQNEQRQGKVELVSYLSNWHRIVSIIRTWLNPELESSFGLSSGVIARDVYVLDDYAYIVTSGAGTNFFIVDISSSTPILVGSLSLVDELTKVIVSGDYAYVGGDDVKTEIQIVNILNKTNPQLISTYNVFGNQSVTGMDILNNHLYFTTILGKGRRDQEFFVLNVSNANSPSLTFSADLNDNPSDIEVIDGYLFISSYNNLQELQVFQIISPANINQISSLNLVGVNTDNNALSLEFSSSKNIAYISREDGYVYFVDLSNKLNPQLINSPALLVTGIPSDLKLFNNENYLAVANNQIDKELKIYDVSNPLLPIEISSLDLAGINVSFSPQALDYSSNYDKLLLVGGTTQQLQIVIPAL